MTILSLRRKCQSNCLPSLNIFISATHVKLKIKVTTSGILRRKKFQKYTEMVLPRNMFLMVAVFLALQLIIAQLQLQILTLLCYWRIHLLTMEVFLMLQVNHRNALQRCHTGCFPDQLNLGLRFISTTELYQRTFFIVN